MGKDITTESATEQQPPHQNRLAGETSAYLRSAAHQPVDWRPWGPEAFEEARRLDRPVLLDIGAVWCHWCHVMDGESYEDPEVATLINARYVPVKVDRDERPDVDRRYQEAVGAIAGQGGWPLTGFLTPEGKVFYGGTYFPPDTRYGRPSFKQVLMRVAEYYRSHKDEVEQSASNLLQELRKQQTAPAAGSLSPDSLEQALGSISASFDIRNGGFGRAPKFPHPSAIQLLLRRYAETGEQWMLTIFHTTLEKMARGGAYDQIGGGFHRYSTDERWIVPHFEKMLYDNSELLRNYVEAYRLTRNALFGQTALSLIQWVDTVLSDSERGGFYTSQDADVAMGDDGDYFTWTLEEAQAVLDEDELPVLQLYYDIQERGEMHQDPRRNVLYVAQDVPQIAAKLGIEEAEVRSRIEAGRQKMANARLLRPTPFVDKTIYANWNGMMTVAYFEAGRELELPECTAFAARTLDRLLETHYVPGQGFAHTEAAAAGSERLTGLLDDQVQMAAALLAGYEATGSPRYLPVARETLDRVIERHWDPDAGGFFDIEERPGALGMLGLRDKPIQDSPTPSANAVAAFALDRLYYLTGEERYREAAEKTLLAFAGLAESLGLYAAAYFVALDHHLNKPVQVVVVGEPQESRTRELVEAAQRAFRPARLVRQLAPGATDQAVPDPLQGMIEAYNAAESQQSRAYVCAGESCGPPTSDPEELEDLVTTFGRSTP